MPPDSDDWSQYRKYVIERLDAYSEHFAEIFERLRTIEVAIASLKAKAGLWGLVGGMIPVLIMLGIIVIRWGLK